MWECPACKRTFKNTDQSHYCIKPETIDQYISTQAPDVQPILQSICAAIREAAPEAAEKISCHIPTFWQKKNLVQLAAHKRHIGFYPGDEAVIAFADHLTAYQTNKGCIQLPLDQPVPYDLIREIVQYRVAQIS